MVNHGTCGPPSGDLTMPIPGPPKASALPGVGRTAFEALDVLLQDGGAFAVRALRAADGNPRD